MSVGPTCFDSQPVNMSDESATKGVLHERSDRACDACAACHLFLNQ